MKKYVIAIIAIWLVIIAFMVGSNEYTLITGREVLLKTAPVDPRDLFRGDYVILNYDINRVKYPGKHFKRGETVYVLLKEKDGYAEAKYITANKPEKNQLFITGKVKYASSSTVQLDYGIENYFVPEGEGKKIERLRGKELSVKVSIDKNGRAKIKELVIHKEEK